VFEHFTDRARKVLVHAQEEARLLNHEFIGTEHILLGLMDEGEGVAAKALTSLDIGVEAVRQKVAETTGHPGSPPAGAPPFTPRSKKVLELSLREAMQLGHKYIGTEHILLALLREGEGVGALVLVDLGASLAQVRTRVIELLSIARYRVAEPATHRGMSETVHRTGDPPFCPHCLTTLEGNLRLISLSAKAADPEKADADWTFVYCETCGRSLGSTAGGTGLV
jgi:ATP-dependent Clp protease ATP-binding subunit ClpC